MEKRIKLVITMIFVFLFSVSALAYLAGKRNLNVIQINADDVAEMPVVVIDAGHGGLVNTTD